MSADIIRSVLLPKFDQVQARGGGWQVRCPAHDDRQASLHIEVGKTQPCVFMCHAGCERDVILDALGLTWNDLCKPREDTNVTPLRPATGDRWAPGGNTIEATYDYTDESGKLLYQVVRLAPVNGEKSFRQRTPDPASRSGWRWKLGGVRQVIYRLPQVIAGIDDGNVIYIAEGEKDVHALEAAGAVATCNSAGAGKWLASYAEPFAGAIVRIVADRDNPGRAHARDILASLAPAALAVEIIEAAAGKDAADHLAAGLTLADFTVTHEAQAPALPELAEDVHAFIAGHDDVPEWVIPHLLERGDRLIWTGEEGMGKTTVTRTLAVAAAAGIHPFTNTIFEPKNVLFIDCENPKAMSRREFRNLIGVAKGKHRPVPDGRLRLIHRPEGIDLGEAADYAWLVERVTAHKPDLLVIGPLYKLHTADLAEEPAARKVARILDEVRVQSNCALIVEAHSPHGEDGRARHLRPIGSSLFRRWPEFGYGIRMAPGSGERKASRKVAEVRGWRGPRSERDWPTLIEWGRKGNDWPWVPVQTREAAEWSPSDCVA
jgi:hypothetical protein